ncbi:MAG: hypothetical protein AB9M53_01150 [Leptothrix sp. (in: b-proteobacteria)]
MQARVLFLKAHVRAYTRKDGTHVAAHSDKRPTARLDDGQLALFPKPALKPMGPNRYKDKHPVNDTPDLFDGLTPREREPKPAPAAEAPAPPPPAAEPAKPHPLQVSADRIAKYRADAAEKRKAGDERMASFYDHVANLDQETHDKLVPAFDAFHKHGDGTELSTDDGRRHVILLPDASNPGKYRHQMFDHRGFMSHSTHDTPEEAVADAARQGFRVHNPGILDKLAGTDEWAHGMAVNALIQAHSSGQMTYAEMIDKVNRLQDERDAARGTVAQTGTSEFKKWFGDSKVVDGDGKPLRVYHGTSADFSEFDAGKAGSNFGMDSYGIFFADKPNISAHSAAAVSGFKSKGGDNIMPVYLSIKNPLVVRSAKHVTRAYDDPREIGGSELFDRSDKERIMKQAKAGGHDGIRFEPGPDGDGMWIAFQPTQIKSATGNRGTFDPGEADITKSWAWHDTMQATRAPRIVLKA